MTSEIENKTLTNPELTSLTIAIIRRCAESSLMTSDGNFSLKHAFEASTIADKLTELLDENDELNQGYEMLGIAADELSWLIEDLGHFSKDETGLVDVDYLNSELLPDLLSSCRTIYQRLERDASWIEVMKEETEKLVEV